MLDTSSLDFYSVCMSINPKRYEYLCKNFNAVGLKSPSLFQGVRWNRGSNTGCVLAHISILKTFLLYSFVFKPAISQNSLSRCSNSASPAPACR